MDPTSCRADVMQVQKGELKQPWKLDLVLVKTKSNATNKAPDKGGNKSRTSKREGPTNPTETNFYSIVTIDYFPSKSKSITNLFHKNSFEKKSHLNKFILFLRFF